MGDCGIATAVENQQLYYNIAKLAFTKNYHQASVGYSFYLPEISKDAKMLSANYVASVTNTSAVGLEINYLSKGLISIRNELGALINHIKTSEYHMGGAYALQLSENSSIGLSLKLLNRQSIQENNDGPYYPLRTNHFSFASTLAYYKDIPLSDLSKTVHVGIQLSNIGPASYINDKKIFLPTNLGIGLGYTHRNEAESGSFSACIDINKLLVPTPPVYSSDVTLLAGKLTNRSFLSSLLGSFADAPFGIKEELKEIRLSGGIEYTYADRISFRTGVNLEHAEKGNRKYIGLGIGYQTYLNDQAIGFDLHYLVPFGSYTGVSPFKNSYGISFKFSIGNYE